MGKLRVKQIHNFAIEAVSALSSINSGQDSAIALNTAKETNVTTDLSYTAAPAQGTVVSSDGTDAVLPLADATNAGLLSPTEKGQIAANKDKVGITAEQAQSIIDNDSRLDAILLDSTAALDTFAEINTFVSGLSDADIDIIAAVALNTAKETNVTTDLSYTAAPAQGTVVSSDGTDAVLPLADATNAGLLSPTEKGQIATNKDKVGITDEQAEKLAGIEANATADQTDAEIRAAVEAATDSNVFTDADHTKLNAIEAGATADQTAAEIRVLVEAATDSNVFTDADHTKLNGAASEVDLTTAEGLIKNNSDAIVSNDADILALQNQISGFGFESVEVPADGITATTFRSKTPVQFAANDELDIFVNGLQVHRAVWENEGLKAAAEGWLSTDGVNFAVQNLGYVLEETDHIIISGKVA